MAEAGRQEWERAEISRSSLEASQTSTRALRMRPENIQRYLAPPPDTPYPLEFAFHVLGDVGGQTVVDFGCGSGVNTLLLAHRGPARVYAFDISESLVRIGVQRLRSNEVTARVQFLVGSAHDLPLPDESVDVVFGAAILHHLDLPAASGEIHRVLRRGGRAVFEEPVRNSRMLRLARRLIPYRAADVSPFEHPLSDAELDEFSRPFRRLRSRAFELPHVRLAHVLPCSHERRRSAYGLDRRVLDRFPRLASFAAIRVFELEK